MLPIFLSEFNKVLAQFQEKHPIEKWSIEFKNSLLNDYSFFSARIEDSKLQYGDTIRFLNNESIRAVNLESLMNVSEHQIVLKNLIDNLTEFQLTEEKIKNIHFSLMSSPTAWETDFKPELVGQFRNFPTIGFREPLYQNKEYAPHYNLEMIVSSYLDLFNAKIENIDNSNFETHLITVIVYFHNIFLNTIHPFADGNGRVCRIIMGAIMMQKNCPPIFPQIMDQEKQIEYISTIIKCEKEKSDKPLIEYLAKGMTNYLLSRI